jgi:hypothetical protein
MYCVNEAGGNKKMAQKATVPIIKIPGDHKNCKLVINKCIALGVP